jgi:hypothetical protein
VTVDPYGRDGLFVGRDDLMRDLSEQLGSANSVLLTGGAGSGKTAVVRRLRLDAPKWQLLRADAHGWSTESLATAFGALRSALENRENSDNGETTRDKLREVATNVAPFTLVIDGADRLLRHSWCGDFFSELRYWDETLLRSRVSFLLTGGPVLAEYQDRENGNSPPVGTAATIPMTPLPATAVQELIDALPTGVRPTLSEVMELTGGNAWLTVELLKKLRRGQPLRAAAQAVYSAAVQRFEFWEQQLTESARRELAQIPRAGRTSAATRDGDQAWDPNLLEVKALTVGVLYHDTPGHVRVPLLFRKWFDNRDPGSRVWDVAISYAPVDEAQARQLADELNRSYEVFFAPNLNIQLVQSDPMDNPPGLYRSRARCELILLTQTYKQRYWKNQWATRPGLLRFGPPGVDPATLCRDDDGTLRTLCGAIDTLLQRGP